MPQKNQYLKEMNKIKIKDNVIANIEKTIKRLEEENSAAKRSIIPNTYIYQPTHIYNTILGFPNYLSAHSSIRILKYNRLISESTYSDSQSWQTWPNMRFLEWIPYLLYTLRINRSIVLQLWVLPTISVIRSPRKPHFHPNNMPPKIFPPQIIRSFASKAWL